MNLKEAHKILLEHKFQEQLFEDRNIRIKGKEYVGFCPFHEDTNPSLCISKEEPIWHCFGCDKSGNWITYLKEHKGLSEKDAIHFLINEAKKIKDPDNKLTSENNRKQGIFVEFYKLAKNILWQKEGKETLKYLSDCRKYSEEEIKKMGIGCYPGIKITYNHLNTMGFSKDEIDKYFKHIQYNGKPAREEYKIVIPYFSPEGNIKGFSGRIIAETLENSKYKPFTYFTGLKETLFNMNNVNSTDTLLIVEGYFDALVLYANGFDNVVAVAGAKITDGQLNDALQLNVDKYILCFDKDPTGKENTKYVVERLLENRKKSYIVKLDEGYKDPDEFIKGNEKRRLAPKGIESFKKAYDEAKNGIEWLLILIEEKYDLSKETEKDDAKKELGELLVKTKNPDKKTIEKFITEKLEINPKDLETYFLELSKTEKEKSVSKYFIDTKFVPLKLGKDIVNDYHFSTFRDTKEIYYYKAGIYIPGGEQIIEEEATNRLDVFFKRYYVNETIGYIRNTTYTNREKFDKNKKILCVGNGLLNIEKNEFKEYSPEIYLTAKIPIHYDKNANCPKIEKFISDIIREEDMKVIQEYIGYCLYKGYPFHKALMLVGDGSNGKSTLLNLIKKLLGKRNISSASLEDLLKNRFASSDLYGKLANIHSDISNKSLKKTGLLKTLTGNDTVRAEKKNKNAFDFDNTAKLIFSANEIPQTNDESTAFFRRWIIIDFPYKFTSAENDGNKFADPNLLSKLTSKEELSGFLNWALKGLHRLLEQGKFSYNKTIEEVAAIYGHESNPIKAFVDDCLELDIEAHETKDNVYSAYKKYCRENELQSKVNNVFGRKLKKVADIADYRPTIDGVRVNCWKGIRIKDEVKEELGRQGCQCNQTELF